MSSKKTINILISLFIVTLLTNCTTLERPKPTGHLIKDQTFVQQTAGQSFIRMTDKNGTAIHTCTMPQPDATFSVTTEEGMGLSIGSEEATMGSSEAEMVGRTPTVLMSRELFFRTCEFSVNYNLSKKEASDLFKTGEAKILEYGVSNEMAWEVGLACGGTIMIYLAELN